MKNTFAINYKKELFFSSYCLAFIAVFFFGREGGGGCLLVYFILYYFCLTENCIVVQAGTQF